MLVIVYEEQMYKFIRSEKRWSQFCIFSLLNQTDNSHSQESTVMLPLIETEFVRTTIQPCYFWQEEKDSHFVNS